MDLRLVLFDALKALHGEPVGVALVVLVRGEQVGAREGDDVRNDAAFPRGLRDANADLGEQLDLRRANSWTSKLEDVSTPELAEVFAINALAPFVINSKLIPVLKDGASDERRRFVINVSAMEGKFYRQKQPTHPHTCRLRVLSTFLGSTPSTRRVITQEHGQGRAEHDDED